MSDLQREGEASPTAGVLDEACRGLPAAFRERMELDSGAGTSRSGFPESRLLAVSLLEAGLRELDQALEMDPWDREGAFSLLAADALLTLACERWALGPDGDERLYQSIRKISERLT